MKTCIFCPTQLDGATKREHILHESIGGSLSSQELVCTVCNEFFGSGIDQTFAAKFSLLMNALGPALKGDFPRLRVKGYRSDEEIVLLEGASADIPKAKVTPKVLPDGRRAYTIVASDFDHLAKVADTMGIADIGQKGEHDVLPLHDTYTILRPIAVEEELREAVKICLEYLEYVEPGRLCNCKIDDAIRYVRHNETPQKRTTFWLENPVSVNAYFDQFQSTSPFCHRIIISINGDTLEGTVILFGSVGYGVNIPLGVQLKNKTVLYQRNILKNAPDDFSKTVDGVCTANREFLPADKQLISTQSAKMRALITDAHWFVDMNCQDHIKNTYETPLRQGHKDDESIDVPRERIIEIVWERIGRVFLGAMRFAEQQKESDGIKMELVRGARGRVFKGESVQKFSEQLRDYIWETHVNAFSLHRKHVADPNYGLMSLGYYNSPDEHPGNKAT